MGVTLRGCSQLHEHLGDADWVSRAPNPSLRKEPKFVVLEGAFSPHENARKLGLDPTVDFLTRVLGANERD